MVVIASAMFEFQRLMSGGTPGKGHLLKLACQMAGEPWQQNYKNIVQKVIIDNCGGKHYL